jgi:hypothetical protein
VAPSEEHERCLSDMPPRRLGVKCRLLPVTFRAQEFEKDRDERKKIRIFSRENLKKELARFLLLRTVALKNLPIVLIYLAKRIRSEEGWRCVFY